MISCSSVGVNPAANASAAVLRAVLDEVRECGGVAVLLLVEIVVLER